MPKAFKKLSSAQYLVLLILVLAVAFLRSQGYLEKDQPPPSEPTAPASQPQIRVETPTAGTGLTIPTGQLSEFDYFVLALSWSPDYCAATGANDPQQCSAGKKLGFVLHGLWPQYEKGYPSDCTSEKMPENVKAQFIGLYPNDKLFDHEWEKHGTCTGLSPLEYLQLSKALKEFVTIPVEFRSPENPFRTKMKEVKALFAQANPGFAETSFEVGCSSSGRYLKEVFVCFSRAGTPTSCSAEMQKTALKSCQAKDFLVRNTR
jgi:ribonuclease T2